MTPPTLGLKFVDALIGATIAFHDLPGDRLVAAPLNDGGTPATVFEPVSNLLKADPYAATSWLPSGTALALAADDYLGWYGSRLFIVNPGGSGLSVVPKTGRALDPAWRPE